MSTDAKWLDAEVVVQLANAADAVGGVGAGEMFEAGCPVCLYGLAGAIDGLPARNNGKVLGEVVFDHKQATTPLLKALQEAGITWDDSDDAVTAQRRREPESNDRATDFEAYLAQLGVKIRGVDDEPTEPEA